MKLEIIIQDYANRGLLQNVSEYDILAANIMQTLSQM